MKYTALILVVLMAFGAQAQLPVTDGSTPPWDPEILDMAATIPIQDGGRVKPFDTFAQFAMLRINGKRFFTTADDKKIYPVEWALDCMFYPQIARDFQHFLVNNDDVIELLQIEAHEEKRSHYSYNELLPGRRNLFQEASRVNALDAKQRNLVEQQALDLAHNIIQFESLAESLELARASFHIDPDSALAAAFPEQSHVRASELLTKMPAIVSALLSKRDTMGQEAFDKEARVLTALLQEVQTASMAGAELTIVPPEDVDKVEWLSFADVMPSEQAVDMRVISSLEHFEKMTDLTGPGDFKAALGSLHAELKTAAEARGEYGKIPLEVMFYNYKVLFYSQWLYVLSFILVAFTWLAPHNKKLSGVAFVSICVPTLLLIVGITLRCIIRSRPPVSTLYETILFITAVAVLVALVMELVNRRGIGLAMGSFIGTLGMFLAFRYEAKEGIDTMPSLVAVLDTNFWLSTHVTTVTMGYAAGLLAGFLGHVYIFGRLFHFKKEDKGFYKTLSRMIYGVLCFGLLFALVGTILGGVWANESWGRFWGWDPKENGALLICLWGLIILHSRMGGYIKDLGVANLSVVLGMIVAFSWWGVNLLGVGLHSYGFTSGIMNMLMVFWMLETAVVAVGLHVGLRERAVRNAQRDKSAPADAEHQGA